MLADQEIVPIVIRIYSSPICLATAPLRAPLFLPDRSVSLVFRCIQTLLTAAMTAAKVYYEMSFGSEDAGSVCHARRVTREGSPTRFGAEGFPTLAVEPADGAATHVFRS